jgi:hypothetical protein
MDDRRESRFKTNKKLNSWRRECTVLEYLSNFGYADMQ